ncbi:hypothetical protein ACFLZB_03500 [Nanoarchaeota archaeon]
MGKCTVCNEAITNPVCPECLAKSISVWLAEKDPSLAQDIHGFETEGPTNCIFCGKNMAVCAHCFSRDIYDYLSQKNSKIAKEFAARFDFEIRKNVFNTIL